jgi:hypothetical protein
MTPAERQQRYRDRLKRKARQDRTKVAPGGRPRRVVTRSRFRGYDDFVPAFNAARHAAIAAYGPRWSLIPEARVWARLPRTWVNVQLTGRRSSTAPRDYKLPVARFWPGGRLPIGTAYAGPTPAPRAHGPHDIIDIVADEELRRLLRERPARQPVYLGTGGRSPHQRTRPRVTAEAAD